MKRKGEDEAARTWKDWSRIQKRLDEKIKENIIAVRLEARYTKEEIITMYLNQFDFLYNAVGIAKCSKGLLQQKPNRTDEEARRQC